MEVQTWTYIIVGLTFALYIGIAIWSRAGSTGEFYVAGSGVHPLANGMATAADWMSAASGARRSLRVPEEAASKRAVSRGANQREFPCPF